MPCWELFERQDPVYREAVLTPSLKARVCVEQAATMGWDRYAGPGGTVICLHTFGSSAPLKDLLTKFGFTRRKVLEAARQRVGRHAAVG